MFLVVYHYLLYPVLIIALARARPRASGAGTPCRPSVTVLIAAYNEERVLAEKLRNTLALDYPRGLLEIIVVSDGSTDGTAGIAAGFAGEGVISMHEPARRGKTAALNRGMRRARGEIVVFSDANNEFSPTALLELVKHFADPGVGGVCGVKRIKPSLERQSSLGDGLYWKYESAIKAAEGEVHSITNADGEIFAIRRALYIPVDEIVINDDAQITFDLLGQGYRLLYEPRAQSYEYASISIRDDFFVKVRMVAGGFQTLRMNWRALVPPRTWFAFTFLSHKALRWIVPELLIAVLILSALGEARWCLALLIAQLAFYTLALYGYVRLSRGAALPAIVYVPFYFCAMNLAALRGLYQYASGWQTSQWRKAQR